MPHDEGTPHARVYKPYRSFEEIAAEKREREMREAGHRPPTGAVLAPYGRDSQGRLFGVDWLGRRYPWPPGPNFKGGADVFAPVGKDAFGLYHGTDAPVTWQGRDEFGYWIDDVLAVGFAGRDEFGRWREI